MDVRLNLFGAHLGYLRLGQQEQLRVPVDGVSQRRALMPIAGGAAAAGVCRSGAGPWSMCRAAAAPRIADQP